MSSKTSHTPSRSDKSIVLRTTKNFIAGTISGIAGTLVGHPFDTLKVRLQTQPVDRPVYRGVVDCFMKTMKWEGIGGLYKGVGTSYCICIGMLRCLKLNHEV